MSDKTQNTKNRTLDEFDFLRIHHLYHFYTFYQTKLSSLSGSWLLVSDSASSKKPVASGQVPVARNQRPENKFDRDYCHLIMKPKLSVSLFKKGL